MKTVEVKPLVEILVGAVILSAFAPVITDTLKDYAKGIEGWYNQTTEEWVGVGKVANVFIGMLIPLSVVLFVGYGVWKYILD